MNTAVNSYPQPKIDKSVLDNIQSVPSKKNATNTNLNNNSKNDPKKKNGDCIIY